MTTANIGIRSGNVIVPFTAATKQTKWFSIYSAITSYGTISSGSVWARFQADSSGRWSIELNGYLNYAADTNFTSQVLSIAGVTFASAPAGQCVGGGFFSSANVVQYGYFQAEGDTSNISFLVGSTAIRFIRIHGFAILKQEPTWASLGTTAAAALEGVIAADVYIPSASASVPGLVDTQAQSFAGVKTFNSGIKLPTSGGNQATLNFYEEYLDTTTIPTCTGATVTSPFLQVIRIGKVVICNWFAVLSGGSITGSSINWGAGIMPARFRPVCYTANTGYNDINGNFMAQCTTSGQFNVDRRNVSGALISIGADTWSGSISWTVN